MSAKSALPLASRLSGKLCLLTAALALIPAIGLSQEYTLTDLGTLGGSPSLASAVNDSGQVVGGAGEPFLYSKGTMTGVWPGNPESGAAVALNNNGHLVVNLSVDDYGDTESYLWSGHNWTDVGIGGATSMNASDMVVGNSTNRGQPVAYWVYAKGQLDTSPGYAFGGADALAWTVNDAGEIAGACANPDPNIGPSGCVFGANISPYRLDNLSVPRGDLAAVAIRSDGTTCGQDNNAAIAIWSSNGTEIFHDSFGDGSACEALNDYGVAVGNFYSPTFVTGSLAFVYDPVSGVRDLNNLITKLSIKGHSVTIENAVSVSNTGFIAANCLYTEGNENSDWRACLLTPNPVLILKDSINQLGKGDPECVQCNEELNPLANSLPESLTDLSAPERRKVLATVEEMERRLQGLLRSRKIIESKEVLLLHEAQLVQNSVDSF